MTSSEKKKCKREYGVEDEFIGHVTISPDKKLKTSQCEKELKKTSETDNSDCAVPGRLLRSRSSKIDKIEKKTEDDNILKKKERENNFSTKSNSPPKKCSTSPDDNLKNVKLSSNKSNISQMHDNESSSNEEPLLLTTPRLSKCRKSLRKSYEQGTVQNQNEKSPNRNSKENSGKGKSSLKVEEVAGTPKTLLEKARKSLHVSSVPESLPCREKEFKDIFSFLQNKLLDGIGGCMYISGVPGTGKTATVTQVIKKLETFAEEGKVPEFTYVEINGMRLANPRQAYVLFWRGLTGKYEKISPERAQQKLDAWFCKNDPKNLKKPTILLVDEFDLLCTKKQDVVYNLLDWPTKSPSRLIVVTIANTMDMPERLFKGRVSSRLGLTRLTFLPYTFKQLEEIILERLTGLEAFSLDAVKLVARKVAAVSGDARRSLDICRRAAELPAPDEAVKLCHVEQAIHEMTNSNMVKIIRSCSLMERMFLRTVSEVSSRFGTEEVDMRDVIEHFLALCTLEGHPRLPVSEILHVCNRLTCFRLIFSKTPQRGILQKLTLNVTHDDIHYAVTSAP